MMYDAVNKKGLKTMFVLFKGNTICYHILELVPLSSFFYEAKANKSVCLQLPYLKAIPSTFYWGLFSNSIAKTRNCNCLAGQCDVCMFYIDR